MGHVPLQIETNSYSLTKLKTHSDFYMSPISQAIYLHNYWDYGSPLQNVVRRLSTRRSTVLYVQLGGLWNRWERSRAPNPKRPIRLEERRPTPKRGFPEQPNFSAVILDPNTKAEPAGFIKTPFIERHL